MMFKNNNKLKFVTYLTVFALSLSTLSSCGAIVRGSAGKSMTVEKGSIPPNFIQKNQTLLILMWGDNSFDKYAKKAFDKYYTGKKKYVTFDELKSEKYSDLDQYQFVYSQGPGDIAMYKGSSYSYTFSGSRPFHIFDRKSETFYKPNFRSAMFGKVMQGHAKQMSTYVK